MKDRMEEMDNSQEGMDKERKDLGGGRENAMDEPVESGGKKGASDTLERIQQAAMEEFLTKGFLEASLRQIVKQAGVTTGAFYGYFSNKQALFASLVEPHAVEIMSRYVEAHAAFEALPEEEKPHEMSGESNQYIHWLVDYICDHRKPVKLLMCGAEGSGYEDFVHGMVEIEVESTLQYMETLRGMGYEVRDLDPSLCHILAHGMVGGIIEIVLHDVPREQAVRDVDQLQEFYTAGWMKLIYRG